MLVVHSHASRRFGPPGRVVLAAMFGDRMTFHLPLLFGRMVLAQKQTSRAYSWFEICNRDSRCEAKESPYKRLQYLSAPLVILTGTVISSGLFQSVSRGSRLKRRENQQRLK